MNRRLAKVAEAIRESVSTTVLFELKDPRVKNVTVIRAEVSPDLQHAKVYISIRGDDKLKAKCLHGLNAARGFIQHKLADRLKTRYTPVLTFVVDRGVELAARTAALLNEVLPQPAPDAEAADETGDDFELPEPDYHDPFPGAPMEHDRFSS